MTRVKSISPVAGKRTAATCILCRQASVEQFLDLGNTALANKFLAPEELSASEPSYPLRVGFCHSCKHVQLTSIVPPCEMFEDYLYISSASDTLKAHLYSLSDVLVERYQLGSDHLVMDIGSNDGTLLEGFKRYGVKTLGVDPAQNLANLTRDNGIERYAEFFNSQSARHIKQKWGSASVITATNTFPHIPELRDFIKGIRTVLAPGGVFVIEIHYLLDLLDQGAFDTIYHEHVSYWALRPMMRLFEENGMEVVDVERLPVHHGQLRVFVQRIGEGHVKPSVANTVRVEEEKRLDRLETYLSFARRSLKIRDDIRSLVFTLRKQGKRVAGYGAPAKGNTLLSFLGMGTDALDYIADRSPLKQGRYTPGLHIPVVSCETMLHDMPDYLLLLAWNFADEVLEQQVEYRRRGGKFILPLPEVRILC